MTKFSNFNFGSAKDNSFNISSFNFGDSKKNTFDVSSFNFGTAQKKEGFGSRLLDEAIGTLPVIGKLAGKSESYLGNVFEQSAEVGGAIISPLARASIGPLLEASGLASPESLTNVPYLGDIRAPGARARDLLEKGEISREGAILRGMAEAVSDSFDIGSWLYGGGAANKMATMSFAPLMKESLKVGAVEALLGFGYGTSDAISDGDDLSDAFGKGLEVAAMTGAAALVLPAALSGAAEGASKTAVGFIKGVDKGISIADNSLGLAERLATKIENRLPFETNKLTRSVRAMGEAKKTLENVFLPQDYLISKRSSAGKELVNTTERRIEIHEIGRAKDNYKMGGSKGYKSIDLDGKMTKEDAYAFIDLSEGKVANASPKTKEMVSRWKQVHNDIKTKANQKYEARKVELETDIENLKTDYHSTIEAEKELFDVSARIDVIMAAQDSNPAAALRKYAKRGSDTLPEATGKSLTYKEARELKLGKNEATFIREGDQIAQELGYRSSEEAREAFAFYNKQRKKLNELFDTAKTLRKSGARIGKGDNLLHKIYAKSQRLEKLEKSDWGKLLKGTKENYFPHQTISVDSIDKRDIIFKQVAENLVRLGEASDLDMAKKQIIEFGAFLKGDREVPSSIIKKLIKSGQAVTEDEARGLIINFRKGYNSPKFGAFKQRTVNLPFYDPNPARVIPRYIDGANKALAEAEMYGIRNEKKTRLLGRIAKEVGRDDADFAKKFLAQVDRGPVKLNAFAKGIMSFEILTKMEFSAVSNATQGLNTLLQTDMPAMYKGFKSLLTKDGKSFTALSGVATREAIGLAPERVNSTLTNMMFDISLFNTVEGTNRKVAAVASVDMLMREFNFLKKNPTNMGVRNSIQQRMGAYFDVDAALKKGVLDPDDLLVAAFRGTQASQFMSRAGSLPQWVNENSLARMAFQLKSFSVHQTRFIIDQTFGEFSRGRPGRAARNLLILSIVYPAVGEVKEWIRNGIMGTLRPNESSEFFGIEVPKEVNRWVDNIASVGGFGALSDIANTFSYGKMYSFAAGPGISDIADTIDGIRLDKSGDWWINKAGKWIPFSDPIINRYFPTNFQKKERKKGTPQLIWPTGGKVY